MRWLTESEQKKLTHFPENVLETDTVTFFTLTKNDWERLEKLRGRSNRLGFALQLCTLRYLGFVPDDLTAAPTPVIEFLARQVFCDPRHIWEYGTRSQTRTDHLAEIEDHLGFHSMEAANEAEIDEWLTTRAVEHDRPLLLLQMLTERMQSNKIESQPGYRERAAEFHEKLRGNRKQN